MIYRTALYFLGIICITLTAAAETPVLVAEFSVDTSLYSQEPMGRFYQHAPGPTIFSNEVESPSRQTMMIQAFRKKNSDEVDIFSYSGKIGTSIIPVFTNPISEAFSISLSCYFIDSDNEWEALVKYPENETSKFKVFDNDGTELLADTGSNVGYGFDGNNTYVTVKLYGQRFSMKTWRFRTGIASSLPPRMAKKATASPLMQVYGISDGQYRVTLTPRGGDRMTFQLFDLLGRCALEKQLDNSGGPTSFIIPEENAPNSPFLARTTGGSGGTVKKVIPVK